MKKIIKNLTVLLLLSIAFSACSKQAQDPYFDRAKTASQKAQDQLKRD